MLAIRPGGGGGGGRSTPLEPWGGGIGIAEAELPPIWGIAEVPVPPITLPYACNSMIEGWWFSLLSSFCPPCWAALFRFYYLSRFSTLDLSNSKLCLWLKLGGVFSVWIFYRFSNSSLIMISKILTAVSLSFKSRFVIPAILKSFLISGGSRFTLIF